MMIPCSTGVIAMVAVASIFAATTLHTILLHCTVTRRLARDIDSAADVVALTHRTREIFAG
jgi:hypothetical protein